MTTSPADRPPASPPDRPPAFPTTGDILALAAAVLPEVRVRDAGALHAAVLRPQTSAFGADAYSSLWEKAAALMHGIVLGHPLVDGNKRLGWAAAVAFLEDNGEILAYRDVDEAERLMISLAKGELDDIPDLAHRLHRLTPPTPLTSCLHFA